MVSRRVASGLPVNADITNGSLYSFKTPSQAQSSNRFLPSEVKSVPSSYLTIQEVLPYIHDESTLRNHIIILKDLDAPEQPALLITTLKSRYFPRGNWRAYLYRAIYPDPFDYQLSGYRNLAIEPNLVPPWQTWRYLSRLISAQTDPKRHRYPKQHEGVKLITDH